MVRNYRFTVLLLGWMALITYLSLASLPQDDLSLLSIPHKDKIVHFIFYFGMVFLGCFSIRERTKGDVDLPTVLTYLLPIAMLYGGGMELLQEKFTLARDGDWYDALANTLGAVMASLVVLFLFSRKGRLNWKH